MAGESEQEEESKSAEGHEMDSPQAEVMSPQTGMGLRSGLRKRRRSRETTGLTPPETVKKNRKRRKLITSPDTESDDASMEEDNEEAKEDTNMDDAEEEDGKMPAVEAKPEVETNGDNLAVTVAETSEPTVAAASLPQKRTSFEPISGSNMQAAMEPERTPDDPDMKLASLVRNPNFEAKPAATTGNGSLANGDVIAPPPLPSEREAVAAASQKKQTVPDAVSHEKPVATAEPVHEPPTVATTAEAEQPLRESSVPFWRSPTTTVLILFVLLLCAFFSFCLDFDIRLSKSVTDYFRPLEELAGTLNLSLVAPGKQEETMDFTPDQVSEEPLSETLVEPEETKEIDSLAHAAREERDGEAFPVGIENQTIPSASEEVVTVDPAKTFDVMETTVANEEQNSATSLAETTTASVDQLPLKTRQEEEASESIDANITDDSMEDLMKETSVESEQEESGAGKSWEDEVNEDIADHTVEVTAAESKEEAASTAEHILESEAVKEEGEELAGEAFETETKQGSPSLETTQASESVRVNVTEDSMEDSMKEASVEESGAEESLEEEANEDITDHTVEATAAESRCEPASAPENILESDAVEGGEELAGEVSQAETRQGSVDKLPLETTQEEEASESVRVNVTEDSMEDSTKEASVEESGAEESLEEEASEGIAEDTLEVAAAEAKKEPASTPEHILESKAAKDEEKATDLEHVDIAENLAKKLSVEFEDREGVAAESREEKAGEDISGDAAKASPAESKAEPGDTTEGMLETTPLEQQQEKEPSEITEEHDKDESTDKTQAQSEEEPVSLHNAGDSASGQEENASENTRNDPVEHSILAESGEEFTGASSVDDDVAAVPHVDSSEASTATGEEHTDIEESKIAPESFDDVDPETKRLEDERQRLKYIEKIEQLEKEKVDKMNELSDILELLTAAVESGDRSGESIEREVDLLRYRVETTQEKFTGYFKALEEASVYLNRILDNPVGWKGSRMFMVRAMSSLKPFDKHIVDLENVEFWDIETNLECGEADVSYNAPLEKDLLLRTADEYYERTLASIDEIRTDEEHAELVRKWVREQLLKEFKVVLSDELQDSGDHFSIQSVHEKIQQRIEIDLADRTGEIDYASIQNGAAVIRQGKRATTPSLVESLPLLNRILSSTGVRFYGHDANAALTPTYPRNSTGQCWSFESVERWNATKRKVCHYSLDKSCGTFATLSVRLAKPIYIRSVVLEHPSKRFTNRTTSAIRAFRVIGFEDSSAGREPWDLGAFEYTPGDEEIVEYKVPEEFKGQQVPKLHSITLAIDSNWGNQTQYACLYRFRVHGDE